MPPQIDALIKDEPGLRSTPPLPQAPLPPSELTIPEGNAQPIPPPILTLRPVRPDSTSSTASSRSCNDGTNTQSSLTITPLVSPKVSLPTELPEQPLASSDNPHFLAAMASAASMALTNPLLLNPLLFSTSMMQSLNESDLIKSMKSLIPQMPAAATAMAAAALPMTMWSLTSQFKKPVIGDTFNGSFAEEEVANIRHLLENVNASVTKSLLEDNLKKWASTCGLSTNEILQQLANAQPLSPGQLKEENDLDTSVGSSSEATFEADSKKASGRPRAMISDEQVATLKAYYGVNPKPRREDLINISEEIGHPFKVVKVWFQNTRARDRRENATVNSKAFTKHLLPPTPPASCSAGSQKCVSPSASPLKEDSEDKIPLDLSTKPSTPSASPPPLVINSEAEDSEDEDMESEEDDDDEDNEEEEEMEVSSTPAFPMTSRPPIDIEQLAKQHFDNMIRAKLVTLEPTAEAMLPDAPVSSSEVAKTATKKVSASSHTSAAAAAAATSASTSSALSTVSSTSSSSNGSNQTIYTCDQCDKTFTKKSSITRHKYEHSGK